MGLRVYKPYEQKEPVKRFGAFTVQVVKVPHGVCECYAYYIKVADRRILYATDFEYFKYSMAKVKLTDMLIECNYQDKYLNLDADNITHKVTGHCSLDTCRKFVEHNATDELRTVILCHLGVETANGVECVEEIKQVVSENVFVDYAQAGRTWYLE